ncbi:MAG: hypothetical protein AAF709_15585 [Pseudomonadota bacterium]
MLQALTTAAILMLAMAHIAPTTANAQSAQSEDSTLFPALNNPLFSTQTFFNQQQAPSDKAQASGTGTLRLSAHLTDTSPPLGRGITWRVFAANAPNGSTKIIKTSNRSEPQFKLPSGTFAVNVTFGLAHLTQTIRLKPGENISQKFIINAGGLKVLAKVGESNFLSSNSIRFNLMSDERDQFGNRKTVLSNVRPGKITRLNSGIYQIISKAGDANAVVSSEVTVEAGKLTEATVIHETAKVTLKLVRKRGGDALADTQWIIKDGSGQTVKQSAGALPTHILAPGRYTVTATSEGKAHTRAFLINNSDNVEVEIVIN